MVYFPICYFEGPQCSAKGVDLETDDLGFIDSLFSNKRIKSFLNWRQNVSSND